MPAAPLRRWAFATMLLLASGSCGRSPVHLVDEGPTIDPWIYALGVCSLKCYRLDQCGLATESQEVCEAECIDDALELLPDDPCWSEQLELRRCSIRETECSGVADEELPAGSDACDHREQDLAACSS